jgi:hypothetical protein
MGVTGTAAAVVLGYLVQLAVQFRYVISHFESSLTRYWPHRQLLAVPLAYLSGFAVSRLLDSVVVQPAGLLLGLAGGSAVYMACLLLVGGLLARDRELAGSVLRRLLPGRGRPNVTVGRPESVHGV